MDTVCKFFPPKLGQVTVLPGSASDKPSFIKRLSLLKGGERIEDRGHYYQRADHQHQQVRLMPLGSPSCQGEGDPPIRNLTVYLFDQ